MTSSVEVSKKESFTLSVNTTGHILYAFVNGRLVGNKNQILFSLAELLVF